MKIIKEVIDFGCLLNISIDNGLHGKSNCRNNTILPRKPSFKMLHNTKQELKQSLINSRNRLKQT